VTEKTKEENQRTERTLKAVLIVWLYQITQSRMPIGGLEVHVMHYYRSKRMGLSAIQVWRSEDLRITTSKTMSSACR